MSRPKHPDWPVVEQLEANGGVEPGGKNLAKQLVAQSAYYGGPEQSELGLLCSLRVYFIP